jgi:hypothetical protein
MSHQKDKTAAYRLFHYKYEMYIPQSFMYGPEYLRKVGYHVSGDGRLDRSRLNEPVLMRQTPAALAIFYDEGAPIQFADQKDAVMVYEDIQEHLLDWERVVKQGIHPDDAPPLTEFRMFEAVAMALYETAKFYEPEERYGDGLRDQLMAMNRRRNPVRTERYLRSKLLDDQGQLKPYVSVVDRIEHELLENNPWQ